MRLALEAMNIDDLLIRGPISLDRARELAAGYAARYRGRRGSMVVDVVASAARNYDRVKGAIVPGFEALGGGSDLAALASADPAALKRLGLRAGEPATMVAVAQGLLRFGAEHGLEGDETICAAWAERAEEWRRTPKLDPHVGVKGIGIALYAYLRMRSGADAIKPDTWVASLLERHGAPIRDPKDALEVLECAEQVARAARIDRLVLDQLLWRGEWKVTDAALRALGRTEAWRLHAPGGHTPASLYGKGGAMGHLYGVPFETEGDLQAALAENHGGGVPMEVIEVLAALCGPRTERPLD